jgi:hypothetical protein
MLNIYYIKKRRHFCQKNGNKKLHLEGGKTCTTDNRDVRGAVWRNGGSDTIGSGTYPDRTY